MIMNSVPAEDGGVVVTLDNPEDIKAQPISPTQAQSKEHEPSPGHPRYKKIYREAKTNGRIIQEKDIQIGQTQLQVEQKDMQIEEALAHTKRLQEKLDKFQSEYNRDRNEDKLSKVEKLMRQAVENSDMEAFDKLKGSYKATQENIYGPKEVSVTKGDQDVETFKRYNPWYGKEYEKTQYANKVDALLKIDPNWSGDSGKTNAELLAEISRRTVEHFGGQATNTIASVPTAGASSGNFVPAKGSKTVTLSATQKNVAERMLPNLSKEEAYKRYAANT